MVKINKLIIENFKKFRYRLDVDFNDEINIFIGDNESGKSTILKALEYVTSGNRYKIESDGFDKIINLDSVNEFMKSEKKYNDLPVVFVEVYLDSKDNPALNGKNNLLKKECDGLRLKICPDDDLSSAIKSILEESDGIFPYDFYTIKFNTFQGEGYTGYKKYIQSLLVDNSLIGDETAIKQYIKDVYSGFVSESEDNRNESNYRKLKKKFTDDTLSAVNSKIEDYSFGLKHDRKSNLKTDLSIYEDEISIDNKGKGRQCFIKTEFALMKDTGHIDIVLLEEPENHLSHNNMNLLIEKILISKSRQLFIATHSNEICSRLNLLNSHLINSSSEKTLKLNKINPETADFFMKAPNNDLLRYVTSNKVILVEGNAEYILMDELVKIVSGKTSKENGFSIISVGGLSFKRYMEIGNYLKIKTAVIRDNDSDYKKHCINNYTDSVSKETKIFYTTDNDLYTFEVCLYNDNKKLCNELFSAGRKSLSVKEYMLQNKAESAYQLLKNGSIINVPDYICAGIKWIID